MPHSRYGALKVRAKTAEVVGYHRDAEKPGKPLHLLIPGGLVALASLAMMIWVAYATWFEENLPRAEGVLYLLLLALVYTGGAFLFSYGYELYDLPRALRLTALIVFLALAAVVILAVLFAILKSSSEGSSESSSSSDDSSSSSGSSGWGGGGLGSIDPDLGGGAQETAAPQVVPEVAVTCRYCGGSYLARETGFACPSCGAATGPPATAHPP